MNTPTPTQATPEHQATSTEVSEPIDDASRLLHLSTLSLTPSDIRHIEWHRMQEFSKKIVTVVQTRYKVFILEGDHPNYSADVETLRKATKEL